MDQREAILSRLVELCAAVDGIESVVRNSLDVPEMKRPAVIILDGAEHVLDKPEGVRVDVIQRMELTPIILLAVRGGAGVDPGALMTLYRNRIVAAVLSDATLAASVSTNGGIRYQGCSVAIPDAEAKEHRIDLNIVFTYRFKLSELV